MAGSFVISAVFTAVDKMSSTIDGISKKVKGMSGTVSGIASVAGKVGRGIGMVANLAVDAGQAVFNFANDLSQAGDEIAKTARSLGLSSKALQEFRYIGERSGVTANEMDVALKRLSITIGEGTNKTKFLFKDMGISIEQLKAAGPDKAMYLIAEGMKNIKDPAQRAAAAVTLFGRNGVKMINVLGEGKDGMAALANEANRLGYVMGEDVLAASEQLNDDILDMQSAFKGLGIQLGSALLPLVVKAVKGLTEVFVQIRPMVSGTIKLITSIFDRIGPMVSRIVPKLMAFFEKFLVAFDKAFVAAVPILEAVFGFFEEIIDPISEIALVMMDLLAPAFEALLPVVKLLLMLLKPIILVLAWLVKIIAFVLRPVIKGLGILFGWLYDVFVAAGKGIQKNWENATKDITMKIRIFQIVFGIATRIIQRIWKIMTAFLASVWNKFITVFKKPIDGILNVFRSIGSVLGSVWGTLLDGARFVWEAIQTGFTTALGFVEKIFFTFADVILSLFGTIVSNILGAAKAVGEFLGQDMSGLEKMMTSIKTMQSEVRNKSLIGDVSKAFAPVSPETNKILAGMESKSKAEISVKVTSDPGTKATVEGVKTSGPTATKVQSAARVGTSVPPFPH